MKRSSPHSAKVLEEKEQTVASPILAWTLPPLTLISARGGKLLTGYGHTCTGGRRGRVSAMAFDSGWGGLWFKFMKAA